MYSQQAYPTFTLNHGIIQDGFEGYHHPSQAFFSPAVRTDNGALGEHQAQVMAWNHTPQLEPPAHINFCATPSHQLNIETPCVVESRKIEESEDSDGSVEKSPLIPQDYPYDWIPDFWPESPNFSSQTQQNLSIPGSEVYLTPPNQSPNTPVEMVVANLESSLCSSAPTQLVAKESNSPASRTVTSLGAQEKILSEDGEDTDMPSEMEMEKFANDMRQKRVNMGYTQTDVSYAMEVLYGKMLSQTMISKFESIQLSYTNMCRIKPFLHRLMEVAENNESLQEMITRKQALAQSRKRKLRTSIDQIAKDSLEIYFMNNPKPDSQELKQIAQDLHMGKEVVHMWFCNRRQKEKTLVVKELSNTGYEPQHIVPLGVWREMPFPGDMSGSPPMYNPAFHHKNMFQQPGPHGMQLGNHI